MRSSSSPPGEYNRRGAASLKPFRDAVTAPRERVSFWSLAGLLGFGVFDTARLQKR